MKFYPWCRPAAKQVAPLFAGRSTGDQPVDLELWLELTTASISPSDEIPPTGRRADANDIRRQLLRVLDLDEVSMVPPSAGDLTLEEWKALSPRRRAHYRRTERRRLDPRLVPLATSNAATVDGVVNAG